MKNFFKSKMNIVFFSIQALAILSLCFSEINGFFAIVAIFLEGVFFIIYGFSSFYQNKKVDKKTELYSMLPISEDEKKALSQSGDKGKKHNILKGVLFICFGVILVFLIIL